MTSDQLRIKTKVAFGVGAAAEAAVSIAFNTFNFLFYNNILGLSGTLTGLAVTIAMVFDAVSDPVVGSLSDRWHSRLGRRHPFLYTAPVPLGICFFCIYAPPAALAGVPLFLWFTAFTVLLRLALTFYHVPHLALGAELSKNYIERSVVMAYQAIFGVLGGASAFFFTWTWFGRAAGGSTDRASYAPMGMAIAVFAALVVFASAYFTRDQIPKLTKAPTGLGRWTLGELFREIWSCLQNKSYFALLVGLVLLSATLGVRETIGSYMNLFFWELPEQKIRFFGLATPPAFVVAFILTPRLHRWLDKRATIIIAVAGVVFASTVPIVARMIGMFPENGTSALFGLLALFVAAFYLSIAILTISVMSALADVADEHELSTGRRQEGVFYSARTLFAKMSSGLGHLIAGVAIDIIRFPTGAKVGEVPAEVIFNLGLVDGPIAAVPSLVAIYFYGRYRIDKKRHAEVHEALVALQTAAAGPAGTAAQQDAAEPAGADAQ